MHNRCFIEREHQRQRRFLHTDRSKHFTAPILFGMQYENILFDIRCTIEKCAMFKRLQRGHE